MKYHGSEKNSEDGNEEWLPTDGEVLNYMFKILGYEKNYDLVIAEYPRLGRKRNKIQHINGSNEIQICVKDVNIIKKICNVTNEQDYEKHMELLKLYDAYNKRRESNGKRKNSGRRNIKSKSYIGWNDKRTV